MPKCQQCGLAVERNKHGEWKHVADGFFAHSASPVNLTVSLPEKKNKPTHHPVRPKMAAKPKPKKKQKRLSTAEYLSRKHVKKGRLPDRAVYYMRFDDTALLWRGVLRVPGLDRIKGEHEGLFRLIELLDNQYRAARGADSPHNSVDAVPAVG